jgi:hypothetical protein
MVKYARPRIKGNCILQCPLNWYIALCDYLSGFFWGSWMDSRDFHGAQLHALDAHLAEFSDSRRGVLSSDEEDGSSLCELARSIARSMSRWGEIMLSVDIKLSSGFDPAMAGRLVIEAVFDELLDGESLGLLDAALQLAMSPQ